MLTPHEIEAAAARLQPHLRRTPVLELPAGEAAAAPLALKLEFLQHSGSFKARGAMNRLLTASVPAAGVVAASGGNHGAAVAYAARQLGHAATIFVPASTPQAKLDRIAAYGAKIVRGGTDYAEALSACRAHAASTGAMDVHAYDDPAVLAGQGTVGLELAQDAPGLTHVLVATGGGGLMGGIASWFARGGVQVVAVEPKGCPTFHQAFAAGRPTEVAVGGVAADSLGARVAGELGFDAARRYGVQSCLVDDEAIVAAQRWLWEHLRVVAEPGGATALAAVVCGAWQAPPNAYVGVILCGANTDPAFVSRETASVSSAASPRAVVAARSASTM